MSRFSKRSAVARPALRIVSFMVLMETLVGSVSIAAGAAASMAKARACSDRSSCTENRCSSHAAAQRCKRSTAVLNHAQQRFTAITAARQTQKNTPANKARGPVTLAI